MLLTAIVLSITCVIAWRLVELQIVDSHNHGRIAADELIDRERIPAQRGIIMDRNEEILTSNILSAELVADRYHLRELTAVVEGLAYNQAIHDERWAEADEPKARNRVIADYRNRLLKNAQRDMTLEEKNALREQMGNLDAKANRLLDYDPEVCEQYYEAHDRLVAEVLNPFLSRIKVKETVEVPAKKVTKRVTLTNSKGKKYTKEITETIPATSKEVERFLTKEDIVNKIAQPDRVAYNREAKEKGLPTKGFRNEIVLAKGLTQSMADQIRSALKEAHIHGVSVQTDLRRQYVMPDMLCHVLGYVDYENHGMNGVEAKMQSYLAGVDGLREYRHNARGQVLPSEDDRYMAPKHGLNLRLTIDMRLQTIVEQELDAGMRHFRAKKGCMIVVDPKTGDILAMVSRPAFNLNTKQIITPYGTVDRDKAVDEKGERLTGDFDFATMTRYEPGSTFKVIAATTAVDKNVMSIHRVWNCAPFSVGFGSKPINDKPHQYGDLPVWGILAKSSNPGAAHVALACKWPNYKEYVSRFGLDKSIDMEMPTGGRCIISDGSNIVNFSRMAYGYSVAVSPLHMAMVYATIANNGVRMKPRVVDKIIAADGSVYDECKPQEVCRVMSEKTAKDIRFALETVTNPFNPDPVRRGTATAAYIPGFRIGGKTGTAKKTRAGGGYADNLYVVSFAGVLPINDPKLVVLTVIDEPHPTDCNPGGGTVAAPIFRAAAERFINVLNLTPSDPAAYEAFLKKKNEGLPPYTNVTQYPASAGLPKPISPAGAPSAPKKR